MNGVARPHGAARAAVQLGGERGGPVADARDGLGFGTGEQQHQGGVREEFDGRGVPADAPAVGDDVGGRVRGVRELRERPAQGGPESGETGGLLGHPEADEDFEPAAQRLDVIPELVGHEPAAGGRRDRQHAGVGVQRAAVGRRAAVHEVAARRVGLGEQDPAGPDRRECHGGGGDSGGTLVCGEGDERHVCLLTRL